MRANEGQAAVDGDLLAMACRRPLAEARPFGETANPCEYVPREATEDALLALERGVRTGRTSAVTAPPGLGKSLLLRLLERRLAPDSRCLFLPYAAVRLDELCAWAEGLQGEPASADPVRGMLLRAREHREAGGSLVLLIDDAGSMPLDTARDLGALIRESGNCLRVVIAAADDAASSRVLAALHSDILEVRFRRAMSLNETRLYIRTRLEQSGVPAALQDRFDEDAIGWVHRLSGGVPRQVHDLATSLLDEAPEGVGRTWKEERWLGAPIGDAEESEPPDLELDPDEEEDADLELPDLLLGEDDPEIR